MKKEKVKTSAAVVTTANPAPVFHWAHFSSLRMALRVSSCVLCAIPMLCRRLLQTRGGNVENLTGLAIKKAEMLLLRLAQKEAYQAEYHLLAAKKS